MMMTRKTINQNGGTLRVLLYCIAALLCMSFAILPAMAATAAFNATPVSGTAPLPVTFTDMSTGSSSERVTNGGFESGDATGWTLTGTDDYSATVSAGSNHAGTYSLYLVAGDVEGGSFTASQAIDLTNVDSITFWSYLGYGDPSVKIDNTVVLSGIADNYGWVQHTIDTSSYTGTHTLTFYSTDATHGIYLYVDDITATGPGAVTAWNWDFGDGNTSMVQNPVHEYVAAGTYTVNLTATDASGSNTATQADLIAVSPGVSAPVAGFASDVISGTAPLTVTFTDQSSNTPTSWAWNFGDGNSSTMQSPVHTYVSAGTYTVNLTATNAAGSDLESKIGYVTVTSQAPVAAFSGAPTSGTAPLTVIFTDASTNGPTSWAWDFGDGSSTNATEQSPVHTYSTAGTYTVNLTATNAAGSDSEVKTVYVTVSAASSGSSLSDLFASHTRANIHGAAAGLTDYQVKFVLYNVTGTDSSENIHLPGIVQPSFNDVRFALSDGTELNYWMETPTGIDNATFWVKMPSIPAGYASTVPVDIYYRNATIGSAADGDATFALFDDFEGSSLDTDKWTIVDTEIDPQFSNSQLILTGGELGYFEMKSNVLFTNNAALRFRGGDLRDSQVIGFRDEQNIPYVNYGSSSSFTGWLGCNVNNYDRGWSAGTWPEEGYRTMELFRNSTHIAVTDGVISPFAKEFVMANELPIDVMFENYDGETSYYDWIFVRQLPDSEPTVNEPAIVETVDLQVSSVTNPTPWAGAVTANILNAGGIASGAFTVDFIVDGNTTTIPVASLGSGSSVTVTGIDPVKNRTVGSTFPVSITVDSGNAIAETDETNNIHSSALTVVRPGDTLGAGYYLGGRYLTGYDIETRNFTEGHVALLHSWGDSGYITEGAWSSTTKQWTAADLPVPANATVKVARLYQSYTWSDNSADGNPGFTVQFNGNTVGQTAFYGDGQSFKPNYNGQAIYDVTPYFNKDGNTALITAAVPDGGLYATVLVVIYQNESEPYRRIWLDEGCDTLFGGHTGYAIFNNVPTTGASSAKLSTMVPSGVDNDQATIGFNSQTVARIGAEGTNAGQDPGFKYYDVTDVLQDGTNELAVSDDGSYINLAGAFLELTYEAPPSEAAFKADVLSGETPLAVQFTDLSYGATGWLWDFDNDGTIDSTEKNPVYTYTTAGTKTVKLTVSNTYGSATETKTGYITVSQGTGAPVAAFSTSATNGLAPVTASFTDQSTNTPTA